MPLLNVNELPEPSHACRWGKADAGRRQFVVNLAVEKLLLCKAFNPEGWNSSGHWLNNVSHLRVEVGQFGVG
jgi:hypothetical protein